MQDVTKEYTLAADSVTIIWDDDALFNGELWEIDDDTNTGNPSPAEDAPTLILENTIVAGGSPELPEPGFQFPWFEVVTVVLVGLLINWWARR